MRDEKLRKINSATQYPSIPTFHAIDPANGMLREELTAVWSGTLVATEKVDGTNARLIVMPDGDWLIGSRGTLLTSRADRVPNYDLGIVEVLGGIADEVAAISHRPGYIVTCYFEVYGQKDTAQYRQYGDGTKPGARLFDISQVRASTLAMDLHQIASWRDRGNQDFIPWRHLPGQADLMKVAVVPELFMIDSCILPTGVEETAVWLAGKIPDTHVKLTPEGKGNAEGLVLRSFDRELIAKLRHQDYRGTLRRQALAERLAERAAKSHG